MKLLEFIHTGGPYGDETSTYNVKINKEKPIIRDIINYVLNETREWGYIVINDNMPNYDFEYRYGFIVKDNIPEEIKNTEIESITASGGWSRMDYYIKIIKL